LTQDITMATDTIEQRSIFPDVRSEDAPLLTRRQLLRGRARSVVLGAIAAFVVGQLAFGYWIESSRRDLRDPIFEMRFQRFERLLAAQPQASRTVVFFGSSITESGVKADVVDRMAMEDLRESVVGYNIGIPSSGPLAQQLYLSRMLRRGVRPSLIVLELTPLKFEKGVQRDIDRTPAHILERDDFDLVASHHKDVDSLRREWWESQLTPAYGHRLMILNRSMQFVLPYSDRVDLGPDSDAHGWRAVPAPAPDDHRSFVAHAKQMFLPRMGRFTQDEEAVAALEELTSLVAREKIPCVFFIAPAGPTFRACFDRDRLARMIDVFQAQANKYGFPIVNAMDWCDEDSFYDSYHLNQNGASAFTERLVREAIVPALRK
jgi:hypothetical protein